MSIVVVVRISPRRILCWAQAILLTFSIVTLGYCAFVLMDATAFQWAKRRRLERELLGRGSAGPAAPSLAAHSPVLPAKPPVTVIEGLLGRLDITRIGLSVMVVEGTSKADLQRAAGHIRGTALPGQVGNVGISAHRDTFFRPLRNIRPNDIIAFTTILGEHRYRVVASTIVDPADISVLAQGQEEILTLVTCYPFFFVGPAPSRFIVRAVRLPDISIETVSRYKP